MNQYYVYILSSRRNGTLYVGVTNNLERRMQEHKQGIFEGFTKMHDVKFLMYYEIFDSIDFAIAREKQLKAGNRAKKIFLIESMNPEWNDLSADWAGGLPRDTSQ